MKKIALLVPLCLMPWAVRAAVSTDTVTSVTVSTSGFIGASVAFDGRNNVHMVFVDTTTQILKYAKLTNGTTAWVVSDVASEKTAPQSDLALSPSGVPHVVYYQTDSPAGVKHARLSGSSWLTDTVENFVGTNTFVSIAVGSDNVPRVVYNQPVSSTTWYGEWQAGVWITTKAFDFTGGPCALALKSDNTPFFLSVNDYFGWRYASLVFRVSASTFSYDDVALFISPGVAGVTQKVGLAIDKSDKAHFSFFDEENGGLIYGSNVGGSTSTVVVDVSTGAGSFSDIAVNNLDKPMIMYFSNGVGLRSAVYDTSWTLSTLEAGTLNGVGPGVVFNNFRHYLAGYLNGDSNELKFITDAPRDLSISGTVLNFSGGPLPGVSLTLSGGIAATALTVSASTGGFTASHLFEGFYALTPSLSEFAFQPASRSYSPLQASQVSQDFLGGRVNLTAVGNLFDPTKGEQVVFNYSAIPGHVSVKVVGLRGVPIRTLVDQDQSAGDYSVTWDGRDTDGEMVASGIYLVLFETEQAKSTLKVAVVK